MGMFPPGVEKRKILVTGLDNAGKTSILDLIQNKMVKSLEMQPTIGLMRREAEILGHELAIYDLGGQGQYRKLYIAQPKYFEHTNAYIFVVDLQDAERYGTAVEYFEECIELFNELNIHPKIYVFLHKFDHAYRADFNDPKKQIRDSIDSLKKRFVSIARRFKFSIEDFYKTSVFDPWSCYAATYDVWSSVITRLGSIQEYLDRLVDGLPDVLLSLLLDEKFNIIGKKLVIDEKSNADPIIDLANNAIKALVRFKTTRIGIKLGEANFVTVEIANQAVLIKIFDADGHPFYLVLAKKTGDEQEARKVLGHLADSMSVFLSIPENKNVDESSRLNQFENEK